MSKTTFNASIGARARSLIGAGTDGASQTESDRGMALPLGSHDTALIARRLRSDSDVSEDRAEAYAAGLLAAAGDAMRKLDDNPSGATLTDFEYTALEAVIHVRGRPAIRVLGSRLESLQTYSGSEFWQSYVDESEEAIVSVASSTGAIVVATATGGLPPYVKGTAWLVSPRTVITNRHVLLPAKGPALIEESTPGQTFQLKPGYSVTLEFAADDRAVPERVSRKLTGIRYVSQPGDPVDIAVLEIEPIENSRPLQLAPASSSLTGNLYVVGHPGLASGVASEVKTVFGKLDGKKRVSFGKRLNVPGTNLVHDASTFGGYSGAPVVNISSSCVLGLHYYGDPASGNLAVAADTLRAHASYAHTAAGS